MPIDDWMKPQTPPATTPPAPTAPTTPDVPATPTATLPPAGAVTWDDYLAAFGLPPGDRTKVNEMIAAGRSPSEIIAWVRGTQWYGATFPGISEAIAKGLLTNELDYRQYLNAVNQQARQYLGRDVTTDEIAGWLREGVTADTVARRFAGEAYVKVYSPEAQYVSGAFGDIGAGGTPARLSDADLKPWGEQQAGLGSASGIRIQAALERAMTRMRGAFAGVAATPGLSVGGVGLSAPGLSGVRGGGQIPDIAT